MPDDAILTFEEAIADDESRSNGRSILLGNGFSVDWRPDVFHYDSLYEEADLSGLSVDKTLLFNSLATHDFEIVIEHLRSAAALASTYGAEDALVDGLRSDAQVVRNGLADVLAHRHPHNATEVSDVELEHAREFLAKFGRIFTLNYDLLLYWVLNRTNASHAAPHRADGFQWPTTDDRSYLMWKRQAATSGQRVFWLHGGLHLFVRDGRLRKLSHSWGEPLIEQVRASLADGRYPLVVTEGRMEEKLERIERSSYLRYCKQALEELTGTLFIQGASLSDNDQHITSIIEARESNIDALYVGLHEPGGAGADELVRRCERIARRRRDNGGRTLTVQYYNASSAHVWRE